MTRVLVLSLAILALPGLALAKPPGKSLTKARLLDRSLIKAEISFDQVSGHQKGTRFALRWDQAKAACEVGAASPRAEMKWDPASFSTCVQIIRHLKKARSGLQSDQLDPGPDGRLLAPGHAPVALIRLDTFRWRASLELDPLCDEHGVNCFTPSRSPGTRLGQKIRTAVLEALNLQGPPPPMESRVDEAVRGDLLYYSGDQ